MTDKETEESGRPADETQKAEQAAEAAARAAQQAEEAAEAAEATSRAAAETVGRVEGAADATESTLRELTAATVRAAERAARAAADAETAARTVAEVARRAENAAIAAESTKQQIERTNREFKYGRRGILLFILVAVAVEGYSIQKQAGLLAKQLTDNKAALDDARADMRVQRVRAREAMHSNLKEMRQKQDNMDDTLGRMRIQTESASRSADVTQRASRVATESADRATQALAKILQGGGQFDADKVVRGNDPKFEVLLLVGGAGAGEPSGWASLESDLRSVGYAVESKPLGRHATGPAEVIFYDKHSEDQALCVKRFLKHYSCVSGQIDVSMSDVGSPRKTDIQVHAPDGLSCRRARPIGEAGLSDFCRPVNLYVD